jgi:NADP-dependent 3-hydroxy acid dehydrogenase YdfG
MTAGKRIAWITGGGTGIGLAGANALVADGWTVIISGRRQEILEKVAAGLDSVAVIALDVSDAAAVKAAAKAIIDRHGQIDVLVNSAGLNVPRRSWADVSMEDWDRVIDINLNGLMYCTQAVLPFMRDRKNGLVINITSWAGRFVGKVVGPAYNASKHAAVALTHSLNVEEFQNGIRACTIEPGEVATDIMKARPVPPSIEDMARMLQPEDVGRTIAFVANMPSHVCINEILISPTHNRNLLPGT